MLGDADVCAIALVNLLEGDEFPVLIHKVSKLQKQVREMRKFMRGLVQLQVEQYEPATIMIQAWWRGCLVCLVIYEATERAMKKDSLILKQHPNIISLGST